MVDLAVRAAAVLLLSDQGLEIRERLGQWPEYLTAVDDVVLLHPRGEEEGPHREEPGHQEEVEEEGEEREEEGAGDVPDGLTGLPYHVGGQGDSLEAAAEKDGEEAGQGAEEDGQTEPEVGAAGHGLGHSLQAGQEDVVLPAGAGGEPLVLRERVASQAGGEADGAAEETDPDCSHGTAVEQTCYS